MGFEQAVEQPKTQKTIEYSANKRIATAEDFQFVTKEIPKKLLTDANSGKALKELQVLSSNQGRTTVKELEDWTLNYGIKLILDGNRNVGMRDDGEFVAQDKNTGRILTGNWNNEADRGKLVDFVGQWMFEQLKQWITQTMSTQGKGKSSLSPTQKISVAQNLLTIDEIRKREERARRRTQTPKTKTPGEEASENVTKGVSKSKEFEDTG